MDGPAIFWRLLLSAIPIESSNTDAGFLTVRVSSKTVVASGIVQFDLRLPDGGALPPFTPGAHLTVKVPNGSRRNYSLCSTPGTPHVYRIAVKRDATGRGGSVSMTDEVAAGDLLEISVPRNNFELHPRAAKFLFIAGGIGITPILSMIRHIEETGRGEFKLYYCSRDRQSSAYLTELESEFPGQVVAHHDHGDMGQAFDFWSVLERSNGTHLYCCGPTGLMDSVRDMSGHWPFGSVHFESFGVDLRDCAENKPFTVRLQKTGTVVEVDASESILDALRKCGLHVDSSCESGTCGACRVRLIAGEAEHRDMVLGEEEKRSQIMVCVSRAQSPELVLDL
jgi:phthalate 4,5-dioxygenase reductase subunit